MFKEFKKFILRGNVVDLAVGVVIGAAFNGVVQSFVNDLISPIVKAFTGKAQFKDLTFTVRNAPFHYGDFLNSLLSFLIIAAVVFFFVVQPINRLTTFAFGDKDTDSRKCPECLSIVPRDARRCKFCTSKLAKA